MSPVCSIHDISNPGSKGMTYNDTRLIIVQKNLQFYVYLNSCPHRGIPLEWQPDQFLDMDKEFIQCAMHGALFSIDTGRCITGPCPGEKLTPIPHCIVDDQIYLV